MLFLLVLVSLIGATVVELCRSDRGESFDRRRVALFLGLLTGVAALLCAFGLLEGRAVRGNATNATPYFVFAFGAFCVAFSGVRTVRLARSLQTSATGISSAFGAAVLSFLGAAYLLFAAADHGWFFRGSDAGVASLEDFGLTEVNCTFALVRIEKDRALYRCPEVIFNDRYAAPFVPWPDYSAGTSVQLKNKYEEMIRSAAE